MRRDPFSQYSGNVHHGPSQVAFKKIFGSHQHKEVLIGFLNAVLELEGDRRIKAVTLKNPWQPPDIPILKETILDIRAVESNEKIRKYTRLTDDQIDTYRGKFCPTIYVTGMNTIAR